MTGRDDRLALLLLANRLVDTGAKPLTASELWPLLRRFPSPAALLGRSADDLRADLDLDAALAERLTTLLDAGTALSIRLDALSERGIQVLSPLDEAYPARLVERLGDAAPPLLHVAGPPELLATDGIGIVGSRNVDEAGKEVAEGMARVAAAEGLPVVSGGARGVDQLAMNAAVEAGGTVVGVLADALTKALGPAETRKLVLAGDVCLCSPFKPDAPFTAGNAMARNKIIYGLSCVTVVVASDEESGGTWAGATEALRRHFGTIAVWRGPGEGPGNAALEQHGAVAVTTYEQILTIDRQAPAPRTEVVQLPFAGS